MRKRLRKKKDKQGIVNIIHNDILDDLEYVRTNGNFRYINHHTMPKFKISKCILTAV